MIQNLASVFKVLAFSYSFADFIFCFFGGLIYLFATGILIPAVTAIVCFLAISYSFTKGNLSSFANRIFLRLNC